MVVSQNKGTYYGPHYGDPPKNYHYFKPLFLGSPYVVPQAIPHTVLLTVQSSYTPESAAILFQELPQMFEQKKALACDLPVRTQTEESSDKRRQQVRRKGFRVLAG